MISQPSRYVRQFLDAGADLLTFHVEAVPQPRPLLEEIRSLGAGAGITLNPHTPVAEVESCLDLCDLVLVMSVMPGFGGQQFEPLARTGTISANLDRLWKTRLINRPRKGHYASSASSRAYMSELENEIEARGLQTPDLKNADE